MVYKCTRKIVDSIKSIYCGNGVSWVYVHVQTYQTVYIKCFIY